MSPLKWRCHRCRFEIADREGVVYCQTWKIHKASTPRNWGERTLAAIFAAADEARWRAAHVACFAEGEGQGYAWDIERLRDVPGLLEFHFHVAEKPWAVGTDLNEFTYAAVKRCWAVAS
ncbi:hypothetical protein [Kineosporia babensis]|uniref:Uncharacterized protein n=1 Tax=Kineosporia babensis TaxID=499548 RepID=A0A9X1NCU6_9ACTN|nr:hypothetical protein [Kineosporia babensis]MCD5310911.1 hypothetical protein [Kineosporia babensis]